MRITHTKKQTRHRTLRFYCKSIYEIKRIYSMHFCLLFALKSLTQKPSVLLFVLFDGSAALLLLPLLRIPLCRHLKSLFIYFCLYLYTAFVQWNFYSSLSLLLALWLDSRWCAKHWLHGSSSFLFHFKRRKIKLFKFYFYWSLCT